MVARLRAQIGCILRRHVMCKLTPNVGILFSDINLSQVTSNKYADTADHTKVKVLRYSTRALGLQVIPQYLVSQSPVALAELTAYRE